MPRLQTYSDMSIDMLQATENPALMVKQAVAITMKQNFISPYGASSNLCKYLLEAEHTSLFEHVCYTFLIQGVSRSFLAQITRQRMSSFTSASQHYQLYNDYPCIVEVPSFRMQTVLNSSFEAYEELIKDGIPREEARQILPNAAGVNILWTINARSLALFLRMRLCNRNVSEMHHFAMRILSMVKHHFPELFDHVGPQCFLDTCKQGKFMCAEGPWTSS